jgi:hypothetical protein
MTMPESHTRGESANRGESPDSRERSLIAVQLEALGHGGCAYDLEAADDEDVADVAYSIIEHLEYNCGAPREEDQDVAARLKAWADRHEKLAGQVHHNHVTRDIKPPGVCPACDEYHQNRKKI